jgi:hypothetical protein
MAEGAGIDLYCGARMILQLHMRQRCVRHHVVLEAIAGGLGGRRLGARHVRLSRCFDHVLLAHGLAGARLLAG